MSGFRTLDGSAPVRIIQVGAGGMGRVWLELLASDPRVELVGLVDLDSNAAAAALAGAAISGVATGTSVTEVVARVGADAVVNVTIPAAHHSVNTEALFCGLPVLCEKPIAPTVAEAISLAAASAVTGQLLMASQSRRYYRNLSLFRDGVRGLGRLGAATTEFFMAPRFGGFRDSMDYPLLLDMAIHPFDVARYLLDSEPVAVYCESYNPSWSWYHGDAAATAVFEFASGVRYTFLGSWCSDGAETSWNGSWRVSGEHGSALWDGEGAPVVSPERAAADAHVIPEDATGETIAGALSEFVDSLRTGCTPSGDIRSNLFSLAMVEAATRSASTQRRVLIADVIRDAERTALEDETDPRVRSRIAEDTASR